MEKEPHLLPYLNSNKIIKVEIITEEYLTESIIALFFHLQDCFPFRSENGNFYLQKEIATPDYTPSALQGITSAALKAASDLYQIKLFVTRKTKSPLISALQESIHTNIISVFYKNIENARSPFLMEFLVKMRPHFKQLKITSDLVLETNPAEKVFTLVRNGYKPMMNIAVTCLQYYADQIKIAITQPNEATLTSPDFFVKKTATGVELRDVPTPIPMKFANEIAQTCLAHILRSAPAEITNEDEDEVFQKEVVTFNNESLMSFEILLPESIPVAEEPEEEISNFRAAAWSLSKVPRKQKKQKKVQNYDNLDTAVNNILFKPLWNTALNVQLDLVRYLNVDQRLIDIVQYLGKLYLMKRGDLHSAYITGNIKEQNIPNLFKSELGRIPFFDFRFSKNSIYTLIPIRLRRIITKDQINVYNKYYQFMLKMKQLRYALSLMKSRETHVVSLRLQLFQILISFEQTLFFRVDVGLYKLINQLKDAKNLQELIDFHADFVKLVGKSCFFDFEQANEQFQNFFKLGFDFAQKQGNLTEDDIIDTEDSFNTFKSFLAGILSVPAQKNPAGLAATLLSLVEPNGLY